MIPVKGVPLSPSEIRALPHLWLWMYGLGRGSSSETIVAAITETPTQHPATPSDIHDLRLCVRLLDEVPELRPHLHLVAKRYQEWAPLLERWDTLTALLRREDRRGVRELLRRLKTGTAGGAE